MPGSKRLSLCYARAVDDDDQGGTGADALTEVLIAQLVRNGVLSRPDIATMKRRLIEGGDAAAAETLTMIVLSDLIDDPASRRAGIHSISGGKADED